MKLNREKVRWRINQDLCNKEKTQTRIQSLLNSFGNKITKSVEIANLLNHRFSTLEEFISLQHTNDVPPKTAPRKFFKFRCITINKTNVLIDSLHTRKPLGHSKAPAWAM